MNAIITDNLERIRAICEATPAVERLYVFGSATRDDFGPDSDVDLLVDLAKDQEILKRGETILDLYISFESLFNRKVDLLTFEQVKNPYFVDALNATAKKIYGYKRV